MRIQNEIYRLINQRRLGSLGRWPPGDPAKGLWRYSAPPPPVFRGPLPAPEAAQAPEVSSSPAPFAGGGQLPTAPAGPREPSVADQLTQLDDLRKKGVISRREFAAKKAELLSRM